MDTQWHRQGDGWESYPPSGVLPLIIGPQIIYISAIFVFISEKPMQALIVRYFWQSCPPPLATPLPGHTKYHYVCIILLNSISTTSWHKISLYLDWHLYFCPYDYFCFLRLDSQFWSHVPCTSFTPGFFDVNS